MQCVNEDGLYDHECRACQAERRASSGLCHLAWQSCCREISERELVSTVDALNVDLDGDEGVKICR